MNPASPNQYFDITRFPKTWGMLVFPVSMSRIGNAQSAQACLDTLKALAPKIQETKVGANFIYSDGLYLNFKSDARASKNRFAQNAVSHMQAMKKLRQKERVQFQIEEAFHFDSWFQMYLSHPDFFSVLGKVKKQYESDTVFQQYVHADARTAGKELTDAQLAFFLEEYVFSYLLLYKQLALHNDYLEHREEWILEVYPGPALCGGVYLCQQNPLGFESSNPYIGQYDSSQMHFIDFKKTDLATYASGISS